MRAIKKAEKIISKLPEIVDQMDDLLKDLKREVA